MKNTSYFDSTRPAETNINWQLTCQHCDFRLKSTDSVLTVIDHAGQHSSDCPGHRPLIAPIRHDTPIFNR